MWDIAYKKSPPHKAGDILKTDLRKYKEAIKGEQKLTFHREKGHKNYKNA